MSKQIKTIENTSIETATSAGGAVFGMIVGNAIGGPEGVLLGGYWGTVVTPIITSLAKTYLLPRELKRMELVYNLGKEKYNKLLKQGAKHRKDILLEQSICLTEGILLKSKDSYEEKKIPLLANLVAHSPFTNTPIDNMLQTLHEADRLSYRQLCLLSIIDSNGYGKDRIKLKLSKSPFIEEKNKHLNELALGVYQDLNLMIVDGIIMIANENSNAMMAAGTQYIVPYNLRLLYPGTLLVNGLELSSIPDCDINPLIKILKSF